MQKIKIRFLINTFRSGGAEQVLIDLLKQLDSSLYEITVVSVEGGVLANRLPNTIKIKCVLPQSNAFTKILRPFVYKMPPSVFAEIFMREHVEIDIAYLEGFPTCVVGRSRSCDKKIAFIHCDVSKVQMMERLYKSKELCLSDYARFDRVCFVSEGAREGFRHSVGSLKNDTVLHNVIDFDSIRRKAQEKTEIILDKDCFKIVSVGRLTPPKKFQRLINIAGKYKGEKKYKIYIIGDGEEKNELQQMIDEKGVTNVQMLGYQSNPFPIVKQADLYICSSIFEGYSTAVSEAVVLGIPVLTTNCAGMDEILQNGECGMIVDNDEESLSKGLENILNDSRLYGKLKERAIERSREISASDALAEYKKLFDEVLL